MSYREEVSTESVKWLTVCGHEETQLAREIGDAVKAKIAAGAISEPKMRYVEKVSLALVSGTLNASEKDLEKLRRLCQLWDVDIRVGNISSHRKFIGPIIVAIKRVLFPLVKVLLKDFLEQQREFNAVTIGLLASVISGKRD